MKEKEVTKENPKWLQKKLLKRYNFRIELLLKLNGGVIKESLYPNDDFHKDDIAFGLLKGNQFIAATDFKGVNLEEPGYISHIAMLQAMGKVDSNKIETDFERSERNSLTQEHYLVRGIVKAGLEGSVLFWESP